MSEGRFIQFLSTKPAGLSYPYLEICANRCAIDEEHTPGIDSCHSLNIISRVIAQRAQQFAPFTYTYF